MLFYLLFYRQVIFLFVTVTISVLPVMIFMRFCWQFCIDVIYNFFVLYDNDVLRCEFSDFDERVEPIVLMICKMIDFTGVLRDFGIVFYQFIKSYFVVKYGIFRLISMEALLFKGLRGFQGGIVVIFDGVKSGEILDFSGFYRSGYRTRKW